MDYEQKYKDALELAKDYFKANQKLGELEENDMLSDIFPELKESEDERVKRCISDVVRKYGVEFTTGTITKEKMLAWLEKHGEQKSIWHNEDEEPQRDSLILLIMQSGTPIVAKIIEPNHTFNRGERWAYIDDLLGKQSEQILANSAKTCKDEQEPTGEEIKTLLRTEYEKGRADVIAKFQKAWSEEDEAHVNSLLKRLEGLCRNEFERTRFAINEDGDWLKSLKDRVQPRRRHTIFDEII